jgi:penicillin-binding protein 2
MLLFDQLKKNDLQLRLVAIVIFAGLAVLLAGLWWVQIVSSREYQANLETQSFRTVRIPAVRGKIQDRNGVVLAENRPTYNVSLYLEELSRTFDEEFKRERTNLRAERKLAAEARSRALNRSLNKQEKKQFSVSREDVDRLRIKARTDVASNVVALVGARLHLPLSLDATNFNHHYATRLALPYPIIKNLTPAQVALFEEQAISPEGVDIEVQSTRVYPFDTTAFHILGCLRRDDDSVEGEESFFSYRMPDFRGLIGIEAGYDKELRGKAGAKSVLVNNVGYRQTENVWTAAEPGKNVILTLDLRIQVAAEKALREVPLPVTRGAAVVMDVTTGDILAMASSPSVNPNYYIQGFPASERVRMNDPQLQPQINRASQGYYAPGSIFKTVSGMAALEQGLDPNEVFHVQANPRQPGFGCIYVGNRVVPDTAPPGDYNFRKAFKLSSNSYFITNAIRAGMESIVRVGQRLHLGERTGLNTRQEISGSFPSLQRISHDWHDGNTANACIGQDPILVTPIQMAVMTAAVANGGKVLWPRLVDRIEPIEPGPETGITVFPSGRVRDELGVRPRTLQIVQDAMLADVDDSDGTGRAATIPGFRIGGKTGTAQVKDRHGVTTDHITWFISYGPYDAPKYAVVIMVESGGSGGKTCAPAARKIYEAILESGKKLPGKAPAVALAQTR